MRILYGVSGEGFGHSSRALVVGKYLEKKGHKVIFMTYGQAYKVLKNKFDVFKVKGLSLIFKKSILKKRKTIKHNLKFFPKNLRKWKKFHKLMKEFNPDICISDMEPIVPILRHWHDLPLISLDNQHRLTNLEIKIPEKYKIDFILAKEVIRTFVRKADFYIVTSFTSAKIKKEYKNTSIVAPIIKGDVRNFKKLKYGNKILVYLTKKDRRILKILRNIDERFVVYGYNKNKKSGNLEFKTKESFLRELVNCKAVIATAGFTLMSESIYLKKPYLALPLKGQFEQTFNALFLKKAGFGEYSEDLNEKEVIYFLDHLKKYQKKLKEYRPDYSKLYKVLDKTFKKFKKSII